jgi:hypothetical protein
MRQEMTMTTTNIKGLPEGNYFTQCGYSQSYPWVEISRTAKTVKLAKVNVEQDPEWKPEFTVGGYGGHCNNQQHQTWLYKGVEDQFTMTVRATKLGWSHNGTKFVEGRAQEFYDYNF